MKLSLCIALVDLFKPISLYKCAFFIPNLNHMNTGTPYNIHADILLKLIPNCDVRFGPETTKMKKRRFTHTSVRDVCVSSVFDNDRAQTYIYLLFFSNANNEYQKLMAEK